MIVEVKDMATIKEANGLLIEDVCGMHDTFGWCYEIEDGEIVRIYKEI